jgi:chemotaxis protein histidine kinase CheA
MRGSKVFSVVAVLGALAVMQVSVDTAWAAKKSHHEKQVKKEKKEKKAKKEDKDKKDEKDKKDDKDKDWGAWRDTNKCPGWISKGCSPGGCRCPVGPEEKDIKKAAEEAKKKAEEAAKKAKEKEKTPKKAEKKEKKPKKAESGQRTQTRNGAEPARGMRSSSSPLSSFVIRYDRGADATRMGSIVAGVSEEAVHNKTLSAGDVPDLDSNLIDRRCPILRRSPPN